MIWLWVLGLAIFFAGNVVWFITAITQERGGWAIAHGLTLCIIVGGVFW